MSDIQARLNTIRDEMATDRLDGFIIPLTDEHMSEYVGDYAQRLAWATGFTGSAGNGVVLKDSAAVFVDGRYTLQAERELDPAQVAWFQFEETPLLDWIADHAPKGGRIGYDPDLTTTAWRDAAVKRLARAGLTLVPVADNPVDRAWSDQPAPPMAPTVAHDVTHAGEASESKRARLAEALKKAGAQCAVITMLDSVAWLFNIRGRDVAHSPVVHAYALIHADATADLFIHPDKADAALDRHLGAGVTRHPRERFFDRLSALGANGTPVQVDPATSTARVVDTLEQAGADLIFAMDPCALPKACKNATEQAGARAAHVRDGVAVTRFLHKMATQAPDPALDELGAAEALWALRQDGELLRDQSFPTISGAAEHGAIVHYRVTAETNRPIRDGELYLVDSGAQYLDGTTDVTRTIAVGAPSDSMRQHYTLVLKGHIALATTRFAKGTSGHALDAIARRPLWQAGLDYDHGTGHGVGAYLNVHEGPQRIAKFGSNVPLAPGMILSNEPGYYQQGAYGIRIENLVLVVPVETGGERDMLGFETLTLAPLDRSLIDVDLLDSHEIAWVDAYHRRVRAGLQDHLPGDVLPWFETVTAPLVG
ncbi:aminopeptidase P family protein [Yunchengibacter salinarum]|uniref:aminopeptidase P family protein n=1 Tax=Yunchengibacter salinarum TaxID=3133399 RepID=UPI0035B63580